VITAIADGGNQSACDPMTNTYSNDVIVTFTDAPAFGTLDVNGQSFAIGTSPQTVTLTGLSADGAALSINALFSSDAGCTFSAADLFSAPANCLPVNTLLINEFDYDQSGSDTEEFLELYNSGTTALDLSSYEVVLVNGNGNSIYVTIQLPAVSLAAGDYHVICFGPNSSAYCDQTESGFAPQNGPDAVGLLFAGNLVDALSYEGVVTGYAEGSASVSDGMANGLSRIPNGTDTDDNSADFQSVCLTPGAANITCVANDMCSGAFDVPVVEFGGPASYVQTSTDNSTGDVVCAGIGDQVVWYSFVASDANDVIHAGVHPQLSTTFPTGFDAVIEVWDACGGSSLGCFNNYGPDQLERALVGGLVPGNTYFYSVHTAGGAGSTTTNEFYTLVKTFADAKLRTPWCGAIDLDLNDVIQSERDDVNELYTFTGVQVPAYGFEFSQNGAVIAAVDNMAADGFYINLSTVPGLQYMQTYDVRVRHQVKLQTNGALGNIWSDYGPVCSIALGAAPTTQVNADWCAGSSNYFLAENILADPLTGATSYRFTFDDGVSPIEYTSNNYSVQLYQAGLEYAKTYSVTVEALLPSGYTVPGPACTLSTAVKPESTGLQMSSCNGTYTWPSSDFILSDNILGAEFWEFRFSPLGAGASFSVINPDLSLTLDANITEFAPGTTYDVDVRVYAGNVWGDFATVCPITIVPAPVAQPIDDIAVKELTPAFDFVIYPNPTAGREIMIEMNADKENASYTLEVTDIAGKTVYTEVFAAKGTQVYKNITFDAQLESGLYIVTLFDGTSQQVTKLKVD
jgi:hypothetical protein